jgi:GNAT superfamily N-acetyltransferase
MDDPLHIRRATSADAAVIAWHRARMFQDMGILAPESFDALRTKVEARLNDWLGSGLYLGWLAAFPKDPATVIGGAGVQLQPILPRPIQQSKISEGRQATIVNVFTEPAWRRRGVASALVKEIIAWSRTETLDRLLLHASDEGRKVYEQLGFRESNEMRFLG